MKPRRPDALDGVFVVGVTGGIASGKSTFARILAQAMPSRLVDADRLGHAVLERPEIAQEVARVFGDDVLDESGRVRRGVLGPRAFASREQLDRLNRIVQEPLTALVESTISAHADPGFTGLVVLDAALLVEWDKGLWCNLVACVVADPARRVERLVARTGLPAAEALRRAGLQLPDAARAAYADLVVTNDGTLEEFERASRAVAADIEGRARAALAARGRLG